MDYVGSLLGGLMLLGFGMERLLSKVMKSARKFPCCKTCGMHMYTAGPSMFMPGEVSRYLEQHNLPTLAASRFMCPKGHYQLWFIPKFGNTEKAFFLKEEL